MSPHMGFGGGCEQHGRRVRRQVVAIVVLAINHALECGKCGGRSKVIAVLKDGLTARKILEHLGLGDAQAANNQPTGPPQLDLPLAA